MKPSLVEHASLSALYLHRSSSASALEAKLPLLGWAALDQPSCDDAVEIARPYAIPLALRPFRAKWTSRSTAACSAQLKPTARLASVAELESLPFRSFMRHINFFARRHGLREMTNWSKVWEYPWLWWSLLSRIDPRGRIIIDLGSELSPIPWYLALLGASVTLIETDRQFESHWRALRDTLKVDVQWKFVTDETLPFPDASADILTSFSVIEHQPDKSRAIEEVIRVLRPAGHFGLSFDICEEHMGMSFPQWNGRALTLADFEALIWSHPAFANATLPVWNLQDIPAFKAWHLQSAPHHNYVTAAAVIRKA